MSNYLLNRRHMSSGPRNDDARLRRMEARLEAAIERIEKLEAKRPPGRPPNPVKEQAA